MSRFVRSAEDTGVSGSPQSAAEGRTLIDAQLEAAREDKGFFLRRAGARKRFERVLDRLAKE